MAEPTPRHPGDVLSALGDEDRLRVFAALLLAGPGTERDVAHAAGVTPARARRALRRLSAAGLAAGTGDTGAGPGRGDTGTGPGPGDAGTGPGPGDAGTGPGPGDAGTGPGLGDPGAGAGSDDAGRASRWRAVPAPIADSARLAARMVVAADPGEAAASAEAAAVLRAYVVDGRLRSIPAVRRKRLVVLDWVSQAFEPGSVYPEAEVNRILDRYHPDHASLRRHLVDEDLMTRREGCYWRSGGTYEVS